MVQRATGVNAKLYAKMETTYGAIATGDYQQMPFVTCELGADQPLEANDVLGLGREASPPSRGLITAGGSIVVPVDLQAFGFWMKLLLGPPTTTGSGSNYTHVFVTGAETLPSATVEVGFPQVSSFFQNTGCMVDSIKFPWSTSGKVNATIAIIAQGEAKTTTSQAGTPTKQPLKRFFQSMGSIKLGGSALGSITGAELTLGNGLDPVRTIRDDGKIDGCDLGVATAVGQINARFADTILLDAATSGDSVALSIGWKITLDRSLVVDLPSVYLPRTKRQINGPKGIEMRFNFQCAHEADSTDPLCTVTLKNDVATY
ncbi:Phage tail protein [Azospirillaceae bacterium]